MTKLMTSSNHWLLLLGPYQILLDILTSRKRGHCIACLAGYDRNTESIFGRVGIEGSFKLRSCWSILDFNLEAPLPHCCIVDVNIILLVPEQNLLHLFVIFQNQPSVQYLKYLLTLIVLISRRASFCIFGGVAGSAMVFRLC